MRQGREGLGACPRRVGVSGRARPCSRRRSGRRSPSPITPPARSSTARRCIGNRRTCSRLVASWSRRCRRRICAAARPAPTTFCSRRSPGGCATARSANIEKTAPDVIAAGNIGCITQIASGTAIPVVHPVELIDWATGGPVPERLNGACRRIAAHRDQRESDHGKEAQGEEESGEGQRRRRRSAPRRRASARRSRQSARPRRSRRARRKAEVRRKRRSAAPPRPKLPPRAAPASRRGRWRRRDPR